MYVDKAVSLAMIVGIDAASSSSTMFRLLRDENESFLATDIGIVNACHSMAFIRKKKEKRFLYYH